MKNTKSKASGANGTHVNRTGVGFSPKLGRELIEDALSHGPSSQGDESTMNELRLPYAKRGASIGSLPDIASTRARKGEQRELSEAQIRVVLDKMGERLAFERAGARIYEGLIFKFRSAPKEAAANGGALSRLEQFHREEVQHVAMLAEIIGQLGGDPTAVTPAASIQGVLSIGIPEVVLDPRTTFEQSIEAILLAELADSHGWTSLVELAQSLGLSSVAERFEAALAEEEVHLEQVRHWVRQGMLAKIKKSGEGRIGALRMS